MIPLFFHRLLEYLGNFNKFSNYLRAQIVLPTFLLFLCHLRGYPFGMSPFPPKTRRRLPRKPLAGYSTCLCWIAYGSTCVINILVPNYRTLGTEATPHPTTEHLPSPVQRRTFSSRALKQILPLTDVRNCLSPSLGSPSSGHGTYIRPWVPYSWGLRVWDVCP